MHVWSLKVSTMWIPIRRFDMRLICQPQRRDARTYACVLVYVYQCVYTSLYGSIGVRVYPIVTAVYLILISYTLRICYVDNAARLSVQQRSGSLYIITIHITILSVPLYWPPICCYYISGWISPWRQWNHNKLSGSRHNDSWLIWQVFKVNRNILCKAFNHNLCFGIWFIVS